MGLERIKLLMQPHKKYGWLLRILLRLLAVVAVVILCVEIPVFYHYTFNRADVGAQNLTLSLGFAVCCLIAPLLLPVDFYRKTELSLRFCDLTLRTLAAANLLAALLLRAQVGNMAIWRNVLLCVAFHVILSAADYKLSKRTGRRHPYLRLPLIAAPVAAALILSRLPQLASALAETVGGLPFVLMAAALAAVSVPALLRDYIPPDVPSDAARRITLPLAETVVAVVISAVCIADKQLVRLILLSFHTAVIAFIVVLCALPFFLCKYRQESAGYHAVCQLCAAASFLFPALIIMSGVTCETAYIIVMAALPALLSLLYAVLEFRKKSKK